MDRKLVQMQKDWLDKYPDKQAAWMIVYQHHEDSPETDGYRLYADRDLCKLSAATEMKGDLIALFGFSSLQHAMDVCRGCRAAYRHIQIIIKKEKP